MAETPAEPDRKPPRFPYVAALLCAACLGAGVWTWIRYSYCWDVTPSEFASEYGGSVSAGGGTEKAADRPAAYVCMAGGVVTMYGRSFRHVGPATELGGVGASEPAYSYVGVSDGDNLAYARVPFEPKPSWPTIKGKQRGYAGRVTYEAGWAERGDSLPYVVDTTASRFHGASVAGLVVGAMGAFVFALHLRQWFKERRPAPAAPDTPC